MNAAGIEFDLKEWRNGIAEILAAGVVRVAARKSSRISADTGESSLHSTADQSGHFRHRELEHRRALDLVAEALLERETIDGGEVARIVHESLGQSAVATEVASADETAVAIEDAPR